MIRPCIVRDLGRMSYAEALSIQEGIAAERKQGRGTDHLLFVEHPHVVTIGRNGQEEMSSRRPNCGSKKASSCLSQIAVAT